MSAYVFALCHRTVDLVAATAASTLRDALGLGEDLIALRRDDLHVLEDCRGEPAAWAAASAAHAAWFNPNTHRHAFFSAAEGAVDAAADFAASGRVVDEEGIDWPRPWLGRILHSDRADLLEARSAASAGGGGAVDAASTAGDLSAWLALPAAGGAFAVSLAAFDAEDPVYTLHGEDWPAPGARVLSLQLWTLALRAADAGQARRMAVEVALTRTRRRGLLIHPQVQAWALAAPITPLSRESR